MLTIIEEKANAELQQKEIQKKNAIYENAIRWRDKGDADGLKVAIAFFKLIPDWKDSNEQIQNCQAKLEELNQKTNKEEKNEKKQKRKWLF